VIGMYQVSRLYDYNAVSRGGAAAAELKEIPRLRPYVELRLVGNSRGSWNSKLHFNSSSLKMYSNN
jgi:hypothetical protein